MIGFLVFALAQASSMDRLRENPEAAGYFVCITRRAGELEPSGESAESISIAASLACDGMVDYAVEAMAQLAETTVRQRGHGSFTDSERTEVRTAARNRLREAGRELAIARIVNMRTEP